MDRLKYSDKLKVLINRGTVLSIKIVFIMGTSDGMKLGIDEIT